MQALSDFRNMYFKFENVRENFILANSVKRHICGGSNS